MVFLLKFPMGVLGLFSDDIFAFDKMTSHTGMMSSGEVVAWG